VRRRLVATLVSGSLLLLSGCAATRAGEFGWLPNSEPLVTLIVTEDQGVVERECAGIAEQGIVVGCQRSRMVVVPGERSVRVVKIVRFTDTLPSPLAFDIDGHELCHAVADLQGIPDPCHDEDEGVVQSSVPWSPVKKFLRRR
jgi:hypothetical protein